MMVLTQTLVSSTTLRTLSLFLSYLFDGLKYILDDFFVAEVLAVFVDIAKEFLKPLKGFQAIDHHLGLDHDVVALYFHLQKIPHLHVQLLTDFNRNRDLELVFDFYMG